MRILLVEDEDRIASFIEKGLRAEGHSVERAGTVQDAIASLSSNGYEMVLLDLLLPDGHGSEVLRSVRSHDPSTPVIVLSAVADVEDKVDVLDLGADDYVTKPFSLAELSARIRAHSRQGRETANVLRVGDLELDIRRRIARRGEDIAVDLPSREYALLEYLMRHPDMVVSRQQILDAVWGVGFDPGSNVVDVYVAYLRRKLDTPGEPSAIETVRGAGYRVRS